MLRRRPEPPVAADDERRDRHHAFSFQDLMGLVSWPAAAARLSSTLASGTIRAAPAGQRGRRHPADADRWENVFSLARSFSRRRISLNAGLVCGGFSSGSMGVQPA